jgi:hypothetical protein
VCGNALHYQCTDDGTTALSDRRAMGDDGCGIMQESSSGERWSTVATWHFTTGGYEQEYHSCILDLYRQCIHPY